MGDGKWTCMTLYDWLYDYQLFSWEGSLESKWSLTSVCNSHGSRIEPPEKSSWPLVLERKIFFPLCERSRRTLGANSMSREKDLRVGWPEVVMRRVDGTAPLTLPTFVPGQPRFHVCIFSQLDSLIRLICSQSQGIGSHAFDLSDDPSPVLPENWVPYPLVNQHSCGKS